MAQDSLTQERLRELLHYDPDTGVFTWKVNRKGRYVREGKIAGWPHQHGYWRICVDRKDYLAHRLAFLYMNGSFPADDVDDINRVKDDNRWRNLRHSTRAQNCKNINATGYYWNKANRCWSAQNELNGERFWLGNFKT